MLLQTLQQVGFDEIEAQTYIMLLKLGQSRASILAYRMDMPRSTVQNILKRLEDMSFVSKVKEKNYFVYVPMHPENLIRIVEMRKQQNQTEYEQMIASLTKVAPQMVSMMRSCEDIPSVQFYRGREAAYTVLFDTLDSKTELKDYANIDAMFGQIEDINNEYVAAREKTSITKRSLLLDTPFARRVYGSGKYSSKSHKGYKWIDSELYPFTIEMNIYDGKVSYLTYVEDDFVGVIIENEYIYQMHESIWNMAWDLLPIPNNC